MNAGMTIATILSLALALAVAGDATTHRGSVSGSLSGPRGVNLNHNETTVRDAAPTKKAGFGCPLWMCNHSETVVRDTAPSQAENTWTLWMGGEQTFLDAFLASLSFYRAGGTCSPWICGTNHSETLVSDAALLK